MSREIFPSQPPWFSSLVKIYSRQDFVRERFIKGSNDGLSSNGRIDSSSSKFISLTAFQEKHNKKHCLLSFIGLISTLKGSQKGIPHKVTRTAARKTF